MTRNRRCAAGALLAVAIAAVALPLPDTGAAARNSQPAQPTISAGYYNALPGFDIMVSGQHFTPYGRADVLILEQGGLRAHDVVTVSAQGTFSDKTGLACDFHAPAITAFDRRSGQWSNQVVLGAVCPG